MRHVLFGIGAIAATLVTVPAQTVPARAQGKPLGAPASDVMPPVELTISLDGGKPVCAPAELRLPADTNVSLHIVSSADAPITITAPGQFEKGHVLHADGDLIHVASEAGYTIKQKGQGTLKIRTMKAGEEEYACTSNRNADAPFKGKLILTPPAG